MGRFQYRTMATNCVVVAVLALFILTNSINVVDARRNQGSSQRKTSSNSHNGQVTQPTYNTPHTGSSNSHADVAKLSYPNYNSQPNRPATAPNNNNNNNGNAPQIGWNVPNSQHGPPPPYSATNPVGGAKTNIHEAPPAYNQPNYAAPPYSGASNVHTPITANNMHGSNYAPPPSGTGYNSPGYPMPAGATYHSGGVPPGATFYGNAGQMPAGGAFYPSGGNLPAGATYLPAGGALPPGATYYSSPPQQSSSGLGFGSGLLAGTLGGALLGHALTPTQTRVVEQAPAAAGSGGQDRVIIINNNVPANTTEGSNISAGVADNSTATPLAPLGLPAVDGNSTIMSNSSAIEQPAPQPVPGGIICVPVRVNETDPTDSSKLIEIEKIACYPAPTPPQNSSVNINQPQQPNPDIAASQPTTPPMLLADQSAVRVNNGVASTPGISACLIIAYLVSALLRERLF